LSDTAPACPFCDYAGPSPFFGQSSRAYVIEPLNPVTEGHRLVIPRKHVPHAAANPRLAGEMMEYAARYIAMNKLVPCNIITSLGHEATQTVDHLHVHIVPRRAGDGLALPWSAR
jgi:histidine triad (HIT) family protein